MCNSSCFAPNPAVGPRPGGPAASATARTVLSEAPGRPIPDNEDVENRDESSVGFRGIYMRRLARARQYSVRLLAGRVAAVESSVGRGCSLLNDIWVVRRSSTASA